jgi:hypothetical protein
MDQYMADRREREEDNASKYVDWYTSGQSEHGTGQFDADRAKRYLGEEYEKESGDIGDPGPAGASGPMGSIEGGIVGSVIGSSAVAALNAYAMTQGTTTSAIANTGHHGNVGQSQGGNASGLGAAGGSPTGPE